jgi:hypothetical protein
MLAAILSSCVFNPLKPEVNLNLFSTSQRTQSFSFTKADLIILFREIIADSCRNHTKDINFLCEKSTEFLNVAAGGTNTYHSALRG